MLTPVEWEKLANFIIANFVTDETLPAPTPDPSHEVIRALDGLHEAIRENTAAVIRAAEASQALVAKFDAERPKKPGRPSNAEREAVKALQNEAPPPKPGPTPEPMFTELDPPPPAEEVSAATPPAAAVDDNAPAHAAAAEAPRDAGAVVEAPAPAAAEAPPAAAATGPVEAPEEVSESDVKRQLRRMQQKFPQDGIARITKILKPFGTARFSDLSPEHYREVYAAAEAELR